MPDMLNGEVKVTGVVSVLDRSARIVGSPRSKAAGMPRVRAILRHAVLHSARSEDMGWVGVFVGTLVYGCNA